MAQHVFGDENRIDTSGLSLNDIDPLGETALAKALRDVLESDQHSGTPRSLNARRSKGFDNRA